MAETKNQNPIEVLLDLLRKNLERIPSSVKLWRHGENKATITPIEIGTENLKNKLNAIVVMAESGRLNKLSVIDYNKLRDALLQLCLVFEEGVIEKNGLTELNLKKGRVFLYQSEVISGFFEKLDTKALDQVDEGFDKSNVNKGGIEDFSAFYKNIDDLNDRINNLQKKVSDSFSEINIYKTESLGEAEGVLNKILDLNTQISGLQQRVIEYQEVFRSSIDQVISIERLNVNKKISEFLLGYDNQIEEILQNARVSMATISGYEKNAADSVTILSSVTLSDGYSRVNIEEKKQADFWRWVTVAVFVVALVVAIISLLTFTFDPKKEGALWTLGLRLLTAFIITMPAFYAAKESARHRSNADKANRVSLELAVLSPYLSQMSLEKQNEVRERLIDKYFGQNDVPHQVSQPLSLEQLKGKVDTISEMLKTVTDSIKNIKGDADKPDAKSEAKPSEKPKDESSD